MFSNSFHFHKSRPMTGLLAPIGRSNALTPMRYKSLGRKSPKNLTKSHRLNKDLSLSPYNRKIKRPKCSTNASCQSIREDHVEINDVLFSWNCKTSENKFRIIRPCIILKPDLAENTKMFGLCDSEDKDSASLISNTFIDIISQQPKVSLTPKHSLKEAYMKALKDLACQPNALALHDFTVVLLNKQKLCCLNIGQCGLIICRRTIKGWEASKVTGKSVFEKKLEDSEKILIIGNGPLFNSVATEDMAKVASKYWEMRNPNIASWEIIELAKTTPCPICLVLFLGI